MPKLISHDLSSYRREVLEEGLALSLSLQAMGDKLGVTRERVRQLLHKNGLRRAKPLYPTKLSGIDEALFRQQATYMTQKQMSKVYVCSVPTIRVVLAKLRLPKRLKAWEVRRAKLNAEGQLWCTKCKVWKPYEAFYRMVKSKTGYMAVCAPCVRHQQTVRNTELTRHMQRLEKALSRALCGCTSQDCRVHGSYVPEEVEFALTYKK